MSAFISHAFHAGLQTDAMRNALDLIARNRVGEAQLLLQTTLDRVEAEFAAHLSEMHAEFAALWPTVTPPNAPRAQTGD